MEFEEWFQRTLAHEGGYVFLADDRGGATNMGITQQSYTEFMQRPVTPDEMENLTEEEAEDFYRQYWQKMGLEGLPSAIIPFYTDAAVNLGKGGATKVLQMAVNLKLNPNEPEKWIDVDGIRGRNTNKSVSLADLSGEDYLAELMVWYANLILKGCKYTDRTNQNRFMRGWTRRLLENYRDSQ